MRAPSLSGLERFYRKTERIALPCIVLFLLFWVWPLFQTVLNSFYTNAFDRSFAGFQHHQEVLENRYFRLAFSNTIRFAVCACGAAYALGLVFALIVRKFRMLECFVFPLMLLPFFIPSAAVAPVWRNAFPRDDQAFYALLLLFLWKNAGVSAFVMRAALTGVLSGCLEAAQLDGAGFFRKLIRIELPLIRPASFFDLVFLFSRAQGIFKENFSLYNAYPPQDVYMVQNYIYNQFTKLKYPAASAGSLFVLLFILLLAALWMRVEKRGGETESA